MAAGKEEKYVGKFGELNPELLRKLEDAQDRRTPISATDRYTAYRYEINNLTSQRIRLNNDLTRIMRWRNRKYDEEQKIEEEIKKIESRLEELKTMIFNLDL